MFKPGPPEQRYTAAHWGSYKIIENDGGIELAPVEEDTHPSLIGQGWLSAVSDQGVRIQKPAVRKGWLAGDKGQSRTDDSYIEVSWEEAIDRVAVELTRIKEAYGNQSIYGGSYGWASAGRFHHALSQIHRFLNVFGGYVSSRDTYSHAAAEVILPYITGMSNRLFEEQQTSWPLVAEHCTLLLAFGGVSGRTAQIASGGTHTHDVEDWLIKAGKNGMRTVLISPLRGDLDTVEASQWLAIRPGSDCALMLALAYELERNNWHDREFLTRYTSGWEVFSDYLRGQKDGQAKSPQWAAPLCDLSVGQINDLARQMSKERVMISVAWGVQRADHGEQALWAGLALAAMLGQIGQPGTGFAFGYGSTTPPGRPVRFIRWPSLPQGNNAIRQYIPVARIADMLLKPGETYCYNGQELRYPDIKLIYWAGGNPFHHHQDLNRLATAWSRPETVIVHEHSWTATARRADIVLPCTTALERDDLMLNRRDPKLVYMSRAMPVYGEARDDYDIFAAIADRLNVHEEFTQNRSKQEWQHWIWQNCRATAAKEGFELPDFETFRQQGSFTVPNQTQTRVLFESFVADPKANPLATESGKITLFNQTIDGFNLPDCPGHPSWLEPLEWTYQAPSHLFHLLSNQPASRLHSQLDNGSVSKSRKVAGREPGTIHPEAAERLQLSEGDIALVKSKRGACLVGILLSDKVRRDCIIIQNGAWLNLKMTAAGLIDVHGNPNVLTLDKGASALSQGNVSHTALVSIEPWQYDIPEIDVHQLPRMEKRDQP